MNSIWNKNIALFKERFPSLAKIFQQEILDFSEFFADKDKNEIEKNDEFESLETCENCEKIEIQNQNQNDEKNAAQHDENVNRNERNASEAFSQNKIDGKNQNGSRNANTRQIQNPKIQNLKIPIEIFPSKLRIPNSEDFFPTAKENGKYLHSAYNPVREAEQTAQAIHKEKTDIFGTAFFGSGLGYNAIFYARLFPNDTIILVESDARYFFTALSVLDWSDFFKAKNIIVALETSPDQVISILERAGGFKHIHIYENSAQTQHAKDYFSTLNALIERNKKKYQINNSTLEKFSGLWLKNSCRNLHHLAEKDGVNIYNGKLNPKIPALILAAGPTLEKSLPHLKELKKRSVLIAVDTALRPCLKAGVEPDFIILCDPQYYAYRHIAGLSSPSSVLITESAAYPSVFRFACRKIVMCSSMFPLGQFVESKIGEKGVLSAGGSVSTTAWDFARLIGAKNIIFSGLDLGYPDFQTHIRGSTFEEKIHAISKRTNPAEKLGIASLFAAGAEKSLDYSDAEILTDCKMKMFAWWFESKQEEFSPSGIASYSLSEKSLKIPGFKTLSIGQILSLPDFSDLKNEFFAQSEGKKSEISDSEKSNQFSEIKDSERTNSENENSENQQKIGNEREAGIKNEIESKSENKCENEPKSKETSSNAESKSENKRSTESEKNPENATSENKQKSQNTENSERFKKVLEMIKNGLDELYLLAKKGANISDKAIAKQIGYSVSKKFGNQKNFSLELEKIDSAILNSQFKDLAALVFPTESQLSKIYEKTAFSPNKLVATFQRSKIIYSELEKSIKNYLKNLSI
ncbi:MAG: 6-hydroxymethylpterin diphosphokinase MptE-like protein [Treponema sp.]|nr:6-hydroxymethylpterin diphosphokinase MptE-like protein [Treponema sp.]